VSSSSRLLLRAWRSLTATSCAMASVFDKDSVVELPTGDGFRHDSLTVLRILAVDAGPSWR